MHFLIIDNQTTQKVNTIRAQLSPFEHYHSKFITLVSNDVTTNISQYRIYSKQEFQWTETRDAWGKCVLEVVYKEEEGGR